MDLSQAKHELERYLKRIIATIDVTEEEKAELQEEWWQHLTELLAEHMRKGSTEADALQQTIAQFGEQTMLQREVNRSFPSARKAKILNEILIWIVITIASFVGPMVLLNATIKLSFAMVPIILLPICFVMYWLLTKIYDVTWLKIVLFISFYSYVLFFMWQAGFQIVPFIKSWGLFSFIGLHVAWFITIGGHARSTGRFLKAIVDASYYYWTMVVIAVQLGSLTDSDQMTVFIINIFMLYVVLTSIMNRSRTKKSIPIITK